MTIEFLPFSIAKNQAPFSLIITSQNALRSFKKQNLDPSQFKNVFCVGAKTAEYAKKIGFKSVIEGKGTAKNLAALLIDSYSDAKFLYLRGKDITFDFKTVVPCEEIIVYQSSPVLKMRDKVQHRQQGENSIGPCDKLASVDEMQGDVGAQNRSVFSIHEDSSTTSTKQFATEVEVMTGAIVLLYSERTAQIFKEKFPDYQTITKICLSQKIADVFHDDSLIIVAQEPTDDAMMAALSSIFKE